MVKGIAIVLGIILLSVIIALTCFFSDPSASKSRKIAADLIELHRQWETNDNTAALFQSLTNLPFQDGAAGVEKAWVSHKFSVLGLRWEEYYYIHTPMPVTPTSEWSFYHEWGWYHPNGGVRRLAMHKLMTWTNR